LLASPGERRVLNGPAATLQSFYSAPKHFGRKLLTRKHPPAFKLHRGCHFSAPGYIVLPGAGVGST
jgi:hypothetical protein